MKRYIAIVMFIVIAASLSAQIAPINGYCDQGGQRVHTSGYRTTEYVSGIIPSCTVTVYLTGTTNLATIYSNSLSAPLANPFTATNSSSNNPGYFLFYVAIGTTYDVVLSGGVAPLVYSAPVTVKAVLGGSSGPPPASGCGPLASDNTSTLCGDDSLVGATATGQSVFGYDEGNANSGLTFTAVGTDNGNGGNNMPNIVMVGNNNMASPPTGQEPSAGQIIGVGDSNYANVVQYTDGISAGFTEEGVAIGDTNFNMRTPNTIGFNVAIGIGESVYSSNGESVPIVAELSDTIGLGDSPCSFGYAGTYYLSEVICIGDGAGSSSSGADIISIGDGSGGNHTGPTNDNTDIISIGDGAGSFIADGSSDIVAIGDGVCDNLGAESSEVVCLGLAAGPTTSGTQLTNDILINGSTNQSNATVIGNSGTAHLFLFGCSLGQTAYDDGSGTCYTPGGSGGITGIDSGGTPVTPTAGVVNFAAGTNVTLTPSGNTITITSSATAATAFSALTGATNTTAAMVVGTGASFGASGTGTITATAMPAAGLTGTTLPSGIIHSSLTSAAGGSFGTAAFTATTAYDAAGAAATAQTNAETYASNASNLSSGTVSAGLIPTLNQNTTGTAANVTGTVAIAHGGTGAITAPAALTALGAQAALGYTPLNPSNNLSDVLSISTALSNLSGVPTSRTINTHALTGNVVISASDLTIGTLPHAQLPTLLSGDIPNNAANTSGTAANLSGTPALPNGTTATTQTGGDTSTKLATDAFVAAAVAAGGSGNFSGPASAVSGDIVTFNGTTGKLGQDSGLTTPASAIVGISDSQTLTNKNMTSATNSWPTFNQSTTGNAMTATTLAATPTLCSAGQAPAGVNAAGNAQSCTTYLTPSGSGASLTGITAAQVGAPAKIASGSSSLNAVAISSYSCNTTTISASGVLATDKVDWSTSGSIKAVTGYIPSASGGLAIYPAYSISGAINFDVCNWTASSITPGPVTVIWAVYR